MKNTRWHIGSSALLILICICSVTFGFNCPNEAETCWKKGIFVRDIGEFGATEEDRLENDAAIPDHHDFGVFYVDNNAIGDIEGVGLAAVSNSEAVAGAKEYAKSMFNPAVGWVDGIVVRASADTVGSVTQSADLFLIEASEILIFLEGQVGPRPDGYHLVLNNCTHYAAAIYGR